MADNKLLLKQNAEDGFFADDDPLAALALIANFDPQGEVRPRPSNLRREPEFNLEDELLKEFEQYEEPAASPLPVEPDIEQRAEIEDARVDAEPVPAERFYDEPLHAEPLVEATPEVEPDVEPEFVPEYVPEYVRELPELRAVPEPTFAAPAQPVRPVSHPVFDLEDEILREFAAFDAKRASPVRAVEAPVVAPAPVEAARQQEIVPLDDSPIEPEARAHVEAPPPPASVVTQRLEPVFDAARDDEPAASDEAYPGYGDEDLVEETEVSSHADLLDAAALDAMEAEVDPARWQESKESIYHGEQAFPTDTAKNSDQDSTHFAIESADVERWDDEVLIETAAYVQQEPVPEVIVQPAAPAIVAQAPAPVQTPVPVQAPLPMSVAQSSSVPSAVEMPVKIEIPAKPVVEIARPAVAALRDEDDFGLDALLADVERFPVPSSSARQVDPVSQPVVKPLEPVAKPAAQVVDAPVVVAAAVVSQPAKAVETAPPAHDAFDDGAFELDLTEIELDMLEMEVESLVAPSMDMDQIEASPPAVVEVARAAVLEKPVSRHVPQGERSFVAQPPVAEDYSSLPFDPSQVTSEEDPLEALAEMDVPETPVVDHGIPAPTQPDYDIDIDAEMAHIFSRPTEPEPRPNRSQPKPVPQATAGASLLTSADLDEFERALEEDFRRSLSENRATSTPDRVALTPAAYDEGMRQSSTGRRLTILAASVAGLVLIGGAGVYAYWGSPSKMLSTSSEPKIILADKDPVKVEPVDRGGQTVPNQDKAVYERVSGNDKNIAKQERLVTSNEEPVDVVQKTLMPENLPMDDEDQTSSATDTGDTADPRLLPDGQDKNITTTEKVVSGVSPRKVRTMVVRSDGTLVPRDETEDAATPTPAEASQDRPLDITPAATENVPERLSANDAVAKEIQQASADTETDTKAFVPEVQKPSDAAAEDTQTGDLQAVTQQELPAVKTEQQPVVTEDDNSTTADATPVTATDDTKPVEQAAINDAANADVEETAPIREVKTTKISANTPIPENRPVDQPVDIVGKVSNQASADKTQEVASAQPTPKVDDTQSVQTTTTPPGAYVIQIASLPSEAEAQSSYNKLSAKFSGVIGGRGVDIRKAAIKNKGTYYRVRILAGSRQEATELCARYKSAGGSCLVSK